jgi:hypothetical protein
MHAREVHAHETLAHHCFGGSLAQTVVDLSRFEFPEWIRGANSSASSELGDSVRAPPPRTSIATSDHRIYLSSCGMGGRIARPGQRFSDARPLSLLAALSTGNHVRRRLKTTPLHTHTLPSPLHLSIPASSTGSRFRLIVILSQNGSVRSLQQAPPAPLLAVGRTGYNRKERSSNVITPLTPTLRCPLTPGLSSLPSST